LSESACCLEKKKHFAIIASSGKDIKFLTNGQMTPQIHDSY